jgi:hypothetical protein
MRRRCVLAIAFVLTAGSAAVADSSLPPQPPPVSNPLGTGDEKERQACAPDVVKYCKHELDTNANDTLAILGCLQTNRPKISAACKTVLANHGQ